MQKQLDLNRAAEKRKSSYRFLHFWFICCYCRFKSLKALSELTMTTVRSKMKETVKSFYTFLLICLGYTAFASQFSETNFTKLPFACITHIW